jgi:DNA-binding transcriptional MerR regulator
MGLPRHIVGIGVVAEIFGVSPERVRQLDGELMPIRSKGGWRLYDMERVAAVAERRARKAAS